MAEASPLYGLLAEFASPEALTEAAKRARAVGYRRIDAFSPFPVEGVAEALEFRERRVPWLGLAGGIFGAVAGLGMQYYVNFDFPIEVGGRPLYALPAFLVVTFELTVLFSVLVPIIGMLVMNGLPRLHYPVFNARRFHMASDDRFFLCIRSDDPQFSEIATPKFLWKLGARSVEAVPR
jgi:hypothetical protein